MHQVKAGCLAFWRNVASVQHGEIRLFAREGGTLGRLFHTVQRTFAVLLFVLTPYGLISTWGYVANHSYKDWGPHPATALYQDLIATGKGSLEKVTPGAAVRGMENGGNTCYIDRYVR